MEVVIPKYSGFCPGVKKAEEIIFKNKKNNIIIYGELIHNRNYIEYLKKNNIKTIEFLDKIKNNSNVVIRTHGIPIEIERNLNKKNNLIDATCYKVKKLQNQIKSFSEQGFKIIITGKSGHPEVQGLLSYGEKTILISDKKNIEENLEKFIIEKNKYLLVSQTTGNRDLFEKTKKFIESKQKSLSFDFKFIDSICSITSLREKESLKLLKKVDYTFVIGDIHSSNANKLYKRLLKETSKVSFIQDLDELILKLYDIPKFKSFNKVQIVSSSSTPKFIEDKVLNYLKNI